MNSPDALKPVYITDAQCVTGLGFDLDSTWEALLANRSAIKEIGRFSTDAIAFHKASLVGLDSVSPLNEMIDTVFANFDRTGGSTEVIWTGSKGDIDFVERKDRQGFPYFSATHRNYAARLTGAGESGFEINAACASATVGIALAAQRIQRGIIRHTVICGADTVSRFVHFGFSALKALSPSDCRPFDAERDGLCLGDGAFAVALSSEKPAQGPVVEITGWSISNDANHITGPARDGRGLIQAIEKTLKMASMDEDSVEAWCAHGTGTVYNDAMELTAFESVFGRRIFPVFSIKGAIGHTLGAAGGIETGVCIKALLENQCPPTAGLKRPEERAKGRASCETQSFAGNRILTSNSGFGGVNAALLLEKRN